MRLDTMVAQAVAWARVIERALHDRGPWTFRTAHGTTVAHRIVNHKDAEVVFRGMALGDGDETIALYCGDELVTVTRADLTEGNEIRWRLLVSSVTQAA